MATNAIVPLDQDAALRMVATLKAIVYRLRDEQMKEGQDYGTIPGTNDKPVLLLPGMEKLMRALNAVPVYTEKCVIRDYEKNLFHYEYECRLVDAESGVAIPGGMAIGLATSYETKWRWRKAERTCPTCGKPNIRKSKNNDGWYCWAKTGGCGATFPANMPDIMNQPEGRVENDAICDQINTICKIAQKRALSSAIKGASAVSEFFTVDLEDYSDQIITVTPEIVDEKPTRPAPGSASLTTSPTPPAPSQNGSHDAKIIALPADKPATPKNQNKVDVLTQIAVERYGKEDEGKTRIKTSTGAYSYTREPFRQAGIDCESWTTPGIYMLGGMYNALCSWYQPKAKGAQGFWQIDRLEPVGAAEAELFPAPEGVKDVPF